MAGLCGNFERSSSTSEDEHGEGSPQKMASLAGTAKPCVASPGGNDGGKGKVKKGKGKFQVKKGKVKKVKKGQEGEGQEGQGGP